MSHRDEYDALKRACYLKCSNHCPHLDLALREGCSSHCELLGNSLEAKLLKAITRANGVKLTEKEKFMARFSYPYTIETIVEREKNKHCRYGSFSPGAGR